MSEQRATDSSLNLASVWEAIAATVGDRPALAHGDLLRTWTEFEERSSRLAGGLAAAGVGAGSKVCFYLHNGPEYLEGTFAAFKQRAVPCNVNYRYTEHELAYLLDNADAEAVFFTHTLAERLDAVRRDRPLLRLAVQVGGDEVPDWAVGFEALVAGSDPAPPIERSGEDLWFLYTGGTTGMPKGVMWPHRSLMGITRPTFTSARVTPPSDLDDVARVARELHGAGRAIILVPAAPLMHGTASLTSFFSLTSAGCVVTLTAPSFDAHELWRTVQERRVTNLTIVGDAFAKPMVAALEEAEGQGRPYDLSSLRVVVSSGVMWSAPVKEALLARADITLADLVGSSEGVGFASSVARRDRRTATARFRLGEAARVYGDDGREVEPGNGQVGILAVGGPIPLGYYKDPDKTAETFREFDGRIWSVPGDHATVEADGTITLLGRGSVCINTAGEKVFPEEVEEVLKTHPGVADCNVVGVADERWGQAVVAVVGASPGAAPTFAELLDHCRERLAGYKCPKRVVFVERVQRNLNGKSDYTWAKRTAEAADPGPTAPSH